jgi:hypothetical protein
MNATIMQRDVGVALTIGVRAGRREALPLNASPG